MAITTYAELQASISTWTGDTFTTAQAKEIISLAEAKLNRLLRTQDMETRATASTSGEYLALPDDFLEQRSIRLSGTKTVEFVTPSQMTGFTTQTGEPKFYTVVDGQYQFYPIPSASYEIEVNYYKKIPALSDSNTSNWVLVNYPDLYLSSSLALAETFGWNDGRAQLFATTAQGIINEIQDQEKRRRVGSAPLKIRTGITYDPMGMNNGFN